MPNFGTRKGGKIVERRVQHYCYRCGTPWPSQALICPACGGIDRAEEQARPTVEVQNDFETFQFPWDELPWPRQGSVVLYGGPGAGKSSIAGQINPTNWLSKEMDPKPVARMLRRVCTGTMPAISMVNNAKDVARVLGQITKGPIVLDSLTSLGAQDALAAGYLLCEWGKTHDDRVLAILQVNKAGEGAGYMQIPHLFDTVVELTKDAMGLRLLNVTKSRWSGLSSKYWTFDRAGKTVIPDFEAAYSVEGTPGEYWLHPYPMNGARWAGMLDMLDSAGKLKPGSASAAMAAQYMKTGFVEPADVAERRDFAVRHGLQWLEPEDASAELCEDEET
jgi:hypothetical protein